MTSLAIAFIAGLLFGPVVVLVVWLVCVLFGWVVKRGEKGGEW